MVSSSPDFLIKCEIVKCFHLDGNQPSTTEWLTTRVMYDANNETQSFTNRVGIGSRLQCFVDDSLIIFVTRSTSTVLNWLTFDCNGLYRMGHSLNLLPFSYRRFSCQQNRGNRLQKTMSHILFSSRQATNLRFSMHSWCRCR